MHMEAKAVSKKEMELNVKCKAKEFSLNAETFVHLNSRKF